MPRKEFLFCYRKHRFTGSSRETVDQAIAITRKFREKGLTLTLRQLYYQFIKADIFPNTEKQYKRLGRIVTQAREAGEMDWFAIEDRGRSSYGPKIQEDTSQIIKDLQFELNLDMWARQDHYVEVWVEKQALEPIIARPCNRLDVRYMACKGYLSTSEAWRAGLRFHKRLQQGKQCTLIHLADHDPSGLDMTEDNQNRLRLFSIDPNVEVRRIALNMDQIDQYKPPPNPAKLQDSRGKKYVEEHGDKSWELDALEPEDLDDLITSTIEEYRDMKIWRRTLREQKKARKPLETLSSTWRDIQPLFDSQDETLIAAIGGNLQKVQELLEGADLL